MHIEFGDAVGQSHSVAQRSHQLCGGTATGDQALQSLDVGREVLHRVRVSLGVDAQYQSAQPDQRRLLGNPGGDARVQWARRAAQRLGDVGRGEVARGGGDSEPCQRRAHGRALEEFQAHAAIGGHARAAQRNLHGREE